MKFKNLLWETLLNLNLKEREEHYKLNILLLNDSCKAAISNHLYS